MLAQRNTMDTNCGFQKTHKFLLYLGLKLACEKDQQIIQALKMV